MRSAHKVAALSVSVMAVIAVAWVGLQGAAEDVGERGNVDESTVEGDVDESTVASARGIESDDIVEVIDREASFTQGLELLEDGTMVHSRGLYGESGIDILSATGEVLNSQELPDDEFGEGVTVVREGEWDGDFSNGSPELTAYQLTWKSGVVHTWSVPDLVEGPSLHIDGEGWGLCYDDSREALWQSDGSSTLRLLSIEDLTPIAEIAVTEDTGRDIVEVDQLNELECSGGDVWANIWKGDDIVAIEPSEQDGTGKVTLRLSLGDVVEAEDAPRAEDVLNGITLDMPNSTIWVTGKNWEHLYRVDPYANDED